MARADACVVRVVLYDRAAGGEQPGFRCGEAGRAWPHPEGGLETDVRVRLDPNAVHALEGHGVIEALNRLPLLLGPLAPGRDAVLAPGALSAAARILYEADRDTYGAEHVFVAGRRTAPEPVEYRIAIDNRAYQRTLARLQYLVALAGREGQGVWLRIDA